MDMSLPASDSVMAVRLQAEWMAVTDERILEFLATDGPASPAWIAGDARIIQSRSHINLRLRKLLAAGLVEKGMGHGIYEITDEGEAYLAGELDASELPEPD